MPLFVFIGKCGIIYLGGLGMKLYIIMFGNDAYLETIEYSNYKERYQKTIGIPPERVFEEDEFDVAINKVYELNR